MDIYGENHEQLTQKARDELDKAFMRRDTFGRNTKDYKDAQKAILKWYTEIHKPENEYFRVNYSPYSLSWWLHYNVEPSSRGASRLEPFYSAALQEHPITSDRFRQELLDITLQWYKEALKLKDQPGHIYKEKRVVLEPEQTNEYIEQVHDLLVFAETVKERKSAIRVFA